MVFDVLLLAGEGLIDRPFEERKAALYRLLGDGFPALRPVEHFPASVSQDLYRQAIPLRLEGLVAKRLGSIYVPGARSEDWVKCKVPGAVPPERFKR